MGQSAEGTVPGIGGIFLRAHDPAALAGWYRDNLGIVATKAGELDPSGQWSWQAGGGETVSRPSLRTATISRPTANS